MEKYITEFMENPPTKTRKIAMRVKSLLILEIAYKISTQARDLLSIIDGNTSDVSKYIKTDKEILIQKEIVKELQLKFYI